MPRRASLSVVREPAEPTNGLGKAQKIAAVVGATVTVLALLWSAASRFAGLEAGQRETGRRLDSVERAVERVGERVEKIADRVGAAK